MILLAVIVFALSALAFIAVGGLLVALVLSFWGKWAAALVGLFLVVLGLFWLREFIKEARPR